MFHFMHFRWSGSVPPHVISQVIYLTILLLEGPMHRWYILTIKRQHFLAISYLKRSEKIKTLKMLYFGLTSGRDLWIICGFSLSTDC